jgi:hypothetical protein
MLWIEAQWMTVIALLVFGVCYMLGSDILFGCDPFRSSGRARP